MKKIKKRSFENRIEREFVRRFRFILRTRGNSLDEGWRRLTNLTLYAARLFESLDDDAKYRAAILASRFLRATSARLARR